MQPVRPEWEALLARIECPTMDHQLLQQALTHSSYANEEDVAHNERLEFLGDAVLELVCSQFLYQHYPQRSEGELTRMRANLVCEPTLAEIARRLDLGTLLLLGKSQLVTGGRERPSILADAVEALLGAVYLHYGLNQAEHVFALLFAEPMAALERGELWHDYKSGLQELVQREFPGDELSYTVCRESGPDHNKTFQVTVSQGSRVIGQGQGKSKKEAEQMAARQALTRHFARERR